jgi:hypothetical protein
MSILDLLLIAIVIVLLVVAGLVIYFGGRRLLKHLADEAARNRALQQEISERADQNTQRFDQTVREFRIEHEHTISTLLGIQHETVSAVGVLSERVGELGVAIQELRQRVSGQTPPEIPEKG